MQKIKATQLGTIANETIQEVKNNPKDYAARLKNDPKAFLKKKNLNLQFWIIKLKTVLKRGNLMMKAALHQTIICV